MAAQQTPDADAVGAAWPAPPRFYRLYGPDAGTSPPPPPRPVASGQGATFTAFGAVYRADYSVPTLQEQGVAQLYADGPGADAAAELRRLTRRVVFAFARLLALLVRRPADSASAEAQLHDIELLFVNVHHAINSYRPHQARQQLVAALADQVSRRRDALAALETLVADARAQLRHGLADIAASAGAAEPLLAAPMDPPPEAAAAAPEPADAEMEAAAPPAQLLLLEALERVPVPRL